MNTKIINVGNNGIDQQEWNKIKQELEAGNKVRVIDDQGSVLKDLTKADLSSITQDSLNQHVSKSGDAESPLKASMDALVAQINDLRQQQATQQEIQEKQQQLANLIQSAETQGAQFGLGAYKNAADMGEKNPLMGDAKAQVSVSQQGQAQGQGQHSGVGAKAQSSGFMPPAGWSAQTTGAMPKLNSTAYMQTMSMESNIMSSWDAINKNTTRGKQLMQLLFYYSRMAESGDMGAMYQFMKFITYIISKDKAKQQIEMGKKLIQLQELSRSWTNKLMDVQSNSNDPAASNELMKTMTLVKSETDAIATSQKLLSQMMEEFAQVVETLTNTTKAALDTAGRISRTVSTMR